VLRMRAYERIQRGKWEIARLHAWKVIEPHIDHKKLGGVTLFDWFPIVGDPTKAELAEMREEKKKRDAEESKKIIEQQLTRMRAAGYDV